MTHGRTRWVRIKQGQEGDGAEMDINVGPLMDLVLTASVSAVVSTLITRAVKNNDSSS